VLAEETHSSGRAQQGNFSVTVMREEQVAQFIQPYGSALELRILGGDQIV
jgi:hypothetical protein